MFISSEVIFQMKNNLVILQGVCRIWSNPPCGVSGAIVLGLLDSGEPVVTLAIVGTGRRRNWVVCLTRYGTCQIHRDYLRTAF